METLKVHVSARGNGDKGGVIYCIKDPRDGLIRYVGLTTNLEVRKTRHLLDARNGKTPKDNWLRGLLKVGAAPLFEILERCKVEDLPAMERRFIWLGLEEFDWPLLNVSAGGEVGGGNQNGGNYLESKEGRRILSQEIRRWSSLYKDESILSLLSLPMKECFEKFSFLIHKKLECQQGGNAWARDLIKSLKQMAESESEFPLMGIGADGEDGTGYSFCMELFAQSYRDL